MELHVDLQDGETMAMIKCSECGKDISDTAPACVGCGAPMVVAAATADNANKPDLRDIKSVVSSMTATVKAAAETATKKVIETAAAAAEQGKELVKSKQQKDADAVKTLVETFGEGTHQSQSASDLSRARFTSRLDSTIDVKFAEIMRGKADTDKFLTFVDGQILTAAVRNVFKNALDVVPPQMEAACKLSEAILAPSAQEREQLIKSVVAIIGGTTSIGMIIAGIGGALGWGAPIVASVSAFFFGTSVAGPAGWVVSGVALAGIAAYFATTGNQAKDTERFLNVLKSSTSHAIEAIWPEYETALVKVLGSESAS